MKFGSLEVLATAKGYWNPKDKRIFGFCHCSEYNRYAWVSMSNLKTGNTTCGRNFPYKDFTQCRDLEHFLSQFKWWLNDKGYYETAKDNKIVGKHRLVWETVHGPIPTDLVIDHIDRNRTNNDINNLRAVPSYINKRNVKSRSNTGEKYISRDKQGFYRVQIRRKYLGIRKTLGEAILLRNKHLNKDDFVY